MRYLYDFQRPAKLAKRCPCCGCAKIVTDDSEWSKQHGHERSVGIECAECGLTVTGHGDNYGASYRDALTKWNRRAA